MELSVEGAGYQEGHVGRLRLALCGIRDAHHFGRSVRRSIWRLVVLSAAAPTRVFVFAYSSIGP